MVWADACYGLVLLPAFAWCWVLPGPIWWLPGDCLALSGAVWSCLGLPGGDPTLSGVVWWLSDAIWSYLGLCGGSLEALIAVWVLSGAIWEPSSWLRLEAHQKATHTVQITVRET